MKPLVKVRILILSDTHDLNLTELASGKAGGKPLPKVDVVLHCGDLTENGGLRNYEKVIRGLSVIDAELRLVIAGNHDISLDRDFMKQQSGNIDEHNKAMELWKGQFARGHGVTFLEEGTHTFSLSNGAAFTVYATPFTPQYGVSAFQYVSGEDRFNLADQTPAWAINNSTTTSIVPAFPAVDIVMSHGPPKYILDDCDNGKTTAGCEHLRRAICRAKPRLHCFGHAHASWGARRILWYEEAVRSGDGDDLYGMEHGQDDDDMVPLAPEFVGRNSSRKKGYAAVGGLSGGGMVYGKQTLMVNAAMGNDEGEYENPPWIVELDLLRSTVEGSIKAF